MESSDEMNVTVSHSVFLGQGLIGLGRGTDGSYVIWRPSRMRALMLGSGFQLKMVGPNTACLFTKMVDFHSFGNWANVLFPRTAVGTLGAADASLSTSDYSVPILILPTFGNETHSFVTAIFDRIVVWISHLHQFARVVTLQIWHRLTFYMTKIFLGPFRKLRRLSAAAEAERHLAFKDRRSLTMPLGVIVRFALHPALAGVGAIGQLRTLLAPTLAKSTRITHRVVPFCLNRTLTAPWGHPVNAGWPNYSALAVAA